MMAVGKNKALNEKYFLNKSDIILIVIVFSVGLAALIIHLASMKSGRTVTVYIGGKEVKAFSLDDNTEYKIVVNDKNGIQTDYNYLVIKDGEAYITEASCPEQLCVKHNPISGINETIVCLPHKVVVEIE